MKKEYITPLTGVRKMQSESLLVTISSGGTGDNGDTAQTKEFTDDWDNIWDDADM